MSFKILSRPGRGDGNPYVDLFYDALEPYSLYLRGEFEFSQRYFQKYISDFDAIHFHWPELIWRAYEAPFLQRLRNCNIPGSWKAYKTINKLFAKTIKKNSIHVFKKNIKFLKKHDKKIIWTWHNVDPHESEGKEDNSGFSILAQEADLIIFHNELSRKDSMQRYEIGGETVIMPHGNYKGVYPVPKSREKVLRGIGLSIEKPTVGCFGNLRGYKGFDIACDAVSSFNGSIQFVCAGKPHWSFDFEDLKSRFLNLKNAVLIDKHLSEQEYSDLTNACDIILLPYKKITGSGVLLAALTLGVGVVSSDLPFFKEVLEQNKNAGRLFKVGDSKDLASKIQEYLAVSSETRRMAAYNLADIYDWKKTIIPVGLKIKSLGWI